MVANIHTGAGKLTQSVMGSKHAVMSLHALTSLFRAVVFGADCDACTPGSVIGWTY